MNHITRKLITLLHSRGAKVGDEDIVALKSRTLKDFFCDPEDYEIFLKDVSDEFEIRWPVVTDIAKYKQELQKRRGFHLSDIFRTKAALHVPDMTVGELESIIQNGIWPENFLFP